jgi:hypothetical protein
VTCVHRRLAGDTVSRNAATGEFPLGSQTAVARERVAPNFPGLTLPPLANSPSRQQHPTLPPEAFHLPEANLSTVV